MIRRRVPQILASVLALAAGGGLAAWLVANPKEAQLATPTRTVPRVRAVEARRQSFPVVISTQGTVEPRVITSLIAEVSGRIVATAPSWDAGAFFSEGELLLEIDPTDYELAVIGAGAEVAQAELRLEREKEEASTARAEWDRIGSSSSKEPSPLLLREPQLREAEALLAAARAQKKKADVDLVRTKITAPFPCRVLETQVEIGQFVNRGTAVGRIYGIEHSEVRVPVPDAELAFLDTPLRGDGGFEEGPAATLHARFAGEDVEWSGRVVRTDAEIDRRTRMTHLVIRVDDPFGRAGTRWAQPLPPGLFVRVAIRGQTLDDVVVLPRHALRDDGRVLVVDAEKRLDYRPVDVLRTQENLIVVGPVLPASVPMGSSRPGLRPGELVCISPIAVVVEGMHVDVETAPPPATSPVSESVSNPSRSSAPEELSGPNRSPPIERPTDGGSASALPAPRSEEPRS